MLEGLSKLLTGPVSDFLTSPAFQYGAGNIGAALGQQYGNQAAVAMGNATKSQIEAKHFRDMLTDFLKSGGKINMDGTSRKTKLELPMSPAGNPNPGGTSSMYGAAQMQGATLPQTQAQPQQPQQGQQGTFNPFWTAQRQV